MMIAIVLVIAGGLAIIELVRASNITMNLSRDKTMYLARQRATYWNGRISDFINILETVADIFNRYEAIEQTERREQYQDILLSLFEDEPDFVRMFTVWKPNALDNMDSRFIGRAGSTETGQFAFALGRETGQVVPQTAQTVQVAMEMMNGPNSRKTDVSHPTAIKLLGKDVYCVRIMVPILNKRLNETVGVVGCQLNIDLIQPRVEATIKEFEEVAALSVYSGNGFVMASYVPERIGKMFKDAEVQFGKNADEAFEAVKAGKEYRCFSYAPALKTNLEIALTPLLLGIRTQHGR